MNVHALNRAVDTETLMASGMALAADPRTSNAALTRFVDHIVELEASRSSMGLDGRCVTYADAVLTDTFERGWQPVELIHVIKRRMTKPNVAMMKAMLGSHSRHTLALSTAPAEWRDQLLELGIDPSMDLAHYRRASRVDARGFWLSLFRLLVQFRFLPSMAVIAPPPSLWTSERPTPSSHRADTKILNKIRGLLAKAESSTFAEESDAFSAKAQELMTRYAIDHAVVDAADGSPLDSMVVTRRFVVENPYADAKMQLLISVAINNGAKAVRYRKLGLISITGMPVDLDLCELLYTSLLVQSGRALEHAGTDARARSRGFRRAFLFGFAWRIRERLAEARVRADRSAGEQYGSSLVPILAERDRAVASVFDEMYPNLRSTKTSVSDRHGVELGRRAADHADITGGREKIEE